MENAIRKFDEEIIDQCELPTETTYTAGSFQRSMDDLPIEDAVNAYELYQ